MSTGRILPLLAHAVFTIALAAAAVAFAILRAWESPVIHGTSPNYSYRALGYRSPSGDDFSGITSTAMIQLKPLLPRDFDLGASFGTNVDLGTSPDGTFSKTRAELIVGDFLQALHVHPLAGRLISVADERRGAPVVLLSESKARQLFGHINDVVGRSLFTRKGFELRVIGVLPGAFRNGEGVIGADHTSFWAPYTIMAPLHLGHWPKGMPSADMVASMPFSGPAPVISSPRTISNAQLAVDLDLLLRNARGELLPRDATSLITVQPYTPFPADQQELQKRIRLSLMIAAAASAIAAINLLAVGWLRWLRRRPIAQIERVLGAKKLHFLTRFAKDVALALFGVLLLLVMLITGFIVVLHGLRYTEYSSVTDLHTLWPTLVWSMIPLIFVVTIAQAYPLSILLTGDADIQQNLQIRGSDHRSGTIIICAEVLLAALLSVAASWSLSHAWHSRHNDLGFLRSPATIVATEIARTSTDLRPNSPNQGSALELELDRVTAAVHSIAPGVPVGFGPEITRRDWSFFPKAASAGKRLTSACVVGTTNGWLQAGGTRILAGGAFSTATLEKNAVLVDVRVARLLFGSARAAVGSTMQIAGSPDPLYIVGVTAPMSLRGADHSACPLVLNDIRTNSYEIQTNPATLIIGRQFDAGERNALRGVLTQAFKHAGLQLNIVSVRTTNEERAWLAEEQTKQARVFVAIALFAWLIALSGVFAQLRLYLTMRKRLMAIYIALGALPTSLYLRVMTTALILGLTGMASALFALPWLAREFSFLSGTIVSPYGKETWIALVLLLLAIATVVHWPALRAAYAEPTDSLHEL
ncbi:MAG TPA: ABC transporter permease [Steroidobacteraceae bacterium]|nr:ABC transporter permease [Steroidobacteraceae bacterium]